MSDIITLEKERENFLEEINSKSELLNICYNTELTLESNLEFINSKLLSLGCESIRVSRKNIVNNPDEASELVLENLVDIQQSITYGLKQFLTWLLKHIKKLIAWAKTSYPLYERVYKRLLDNLSNVKRNVEIDPVEIQAFKDKHKYVCFYLENNPNKPITELIENISKPFSYINSTTYPIGDLDLKQLALSLGHYESIVKEANSLYPGARVGIMGLMPDQNGCEIKYNVFISNLEKLESSNSGFEVNILLAQKTLHRNFSFNSKFTPSVDDCIKRIKEYLKDIDSISRTYIDMAGTPESIKIYERKIDRINQKFDHLAHVAKFDRRKIIEETNNSLFNISVCLINSFINADKLVQNYLKDYSALIFNQLKKEKSL